MKRILCIDGGGVRGIIAARVLQELERDTGKDVASMFDMVVGTSTGAILAGMLTMPDGTGEPAYTAGSAVRLYRDNASKIFQSSISHKIKGVFGFAEPKYPSSNLRSVLQKYFGNATLQNSMIPTMVTTYDIKNREAIILKSWRPEHGCLSKVDCMLASTAAPSYFEPAALTINGKESAFIDGGVYANNPVLCAIAEAKLLWPKEKNFSVMSVGTGWLESKINPDDVRGWGKAGWVLPIIDILFDGQTHTADYIARRLVNNYIRIDGSMYFDIDPALDAAPASNIELLEAYGRDLYRERKNEVAEFLKRQGEI